jgi:hypothetical protein
VPTTAVQLHHVRTLAQLRRVNKQLAAWDEVDALALLPPTLRPGVESPSLDREQLKSLQVELIACLGELEARYQRG